MQTFLKERLFWYKVVNKYFQTALSTILVLVSVQAQNCKGLVDAGPDQFTCDPSIMIQLNGTINGNPNSYEWSPSAGLSSTKVLDPMVVTKVPGIYKYKLSAEIVGTTNLIVNGNFEGGFSGFSTEYAFKTLGQGFGPDNVAIATNPQAYNGGFQSCGDHTSGSGNMWLVDGSPTAGKKVWCQTVPVTPGNSYQFELYSMMVFPVSPSILEISVNGNPIGGGQVGGMCDWTQMMACFKATSGSATICVAEVTGVSYGNDFALDDIALYEKCIDEDEVEVEIVDLTAKLAIPLKPKCSSDIFDLFATGSSGGNKITYEWSTVGGTLISTNGLTAKARGSGTYTIKVKYDNGSTHCEKEASIDFDAPDKLEGIMSADGTANCKPDSVNINVNMTSGSGVYTYDWSPAGDILFGFGTESVIVNKANAYKVTITDVTSGCKLELEKTVNADTMSPVVSISGDTILDCLRKQINLLSSVPDTAKFLLDWKLPDASNRQQTPIIQVSQTGTYQLVIQDKKNKCTDTAYWNVKTDTLKPIVQLGIDLTIDCIQDSVEIIPNAANNPSTVRYFWTLANGQNVIEDSLKNKFAGTGGKVILRSVNQANGCASADTLIIQDTRAFPSLSLISPDTLTCSKTSVGLDAQSNNTNLRIQWTTQSGSITGSNSNLKAVAIKKGIYYIMIEDTTNHCNITDSVEVFENIIKPDAVLGNDLILKCSDSTITIDGSASSSGLRFKFQWSTPDGKIRGSNSGSQVTVDQAGQYFLILTDLSNNCMDTAQINVINDANKPSVTIDQADTLTCARTLITLNAKASASTGGNLSYQWTSDLGQPVNRANQTNPDIILPGRYNIIVTDQSNGCTAESSVSVSIDTVRPQVNAGPDLNLDCRKTSVMANGSSNATGNQPIYWWSTMNGKFVGTGDPKDIVITGAGIYKLEVTAGNGCKNTDEISVTIDTVKPTTIIPVPDTLTCSRNQVDLNATGSSTGVRYQYLWTTSNGKLNGDSSLNMVKAILAGRYQLKITDTINHCESSANIQVAEDRQNPVLLLDVPGDLTCKIRSVVIHGSVSGTPTYQLLWSGPAGGLTGSINGIQANATVAGWYVLRVTGRNGCSVADSVQVSEITNVPTNLVTSLDQPRCQGDIASLNRILVSGGIGPYQYELDGSVVAGLPVSNISPGLHTLKVVDKNGCETSSNFTIDQPSAVSVSLPPSASVDAGTGLTLQFTTTIPADSIASIEWSPSDKLSCTDCPNPTTTALDEETVFTVTITNKNGCTATASIRIQVVKRGIWVPDVFSPNGDGINDYFYPVAAPGSYKQVRLLQIFDRWGELVFHKENFQPNIDIEGWNGQFKGQGLNPGVYVYQLILEWNNGELANLHGDVSLIR